MTETILLGRGDQIQELPMEMWKQHLSQVPEVFKSRLAFMTPQHHAVRYFVVKEIVRTAQPIRPQVIAEALQLTAVQVNGILDDLEKNLFFLVRDGQGAVIWAYPVTVGPTPHRISFNSGEKLYAA